MTKMVSTGITLSVVNALPATYDAVGYAALTYTKIGELNAVPAFGATTAVVEATPLETGIVEKDKGFTNYGSVALTAYFDDADAGQAIMAAAVEGASKFNRHSFKLTYPSGAVRYFAGKVFSYTEEPGSANQHVGCTMSLEIETKIVRVPA
jgi:hypothetical protein